MKMSLLKEQRRYTEMRGLELAERFYLEYGAEMLHKSFPQLEGIVAVGLAGSGSECFGFDDEISQDHDFEAGFCIFLPDETLVDRKTEFALERAYSRLPKEFMGFKRGRLSAVGGNRHGVIRISDFFSDKTGSPDGELSLREWFFLSEQSLAEATNGKVFCDELGLFSSIRQKLSYLPETVRLKKLAGNLVIMGQSGQYNYPRCIAREESGAGQLAACEFVKSALNVIFLLNKKYIPYYKWSFRALRELPLLSHFHNELEILISSGNSANEIKAKQGIIEAVCQEVTDELRAQSLTDRTVGDIGAFAYDVNDKITDAEIRNLHILYAV